MFLLTSTDSEPFGSLTWPAPDRFHGELKDESIFKEIPSDHRKSMFESLVVKAREAEEDAEKARFKKVFPKFSKHISRVHPNVFMSWDQVRVSPFCTHAFDKPI